MYGSVCVAWPCHKGPSPLVRAPLLSCGQTTASWSRQVSPSHPGCLLQTRGALRFRKLWRSIVRCDIVVWDDNWWHAQPRDNLVKPNACLDVTAIPVLHTTPLPIFLGHPSLHDLVDRVDTAAMKLFNSTEEC